MRRIFVIPMLLFLIGATPMPTQHFEGPDAATLFLYGISEAGRAVVFVDGLPVVHLPVDQIVVTVKVAHGKHSVWATLPHRNIAPVLVDLKPGEDCYIVSDPFSSFGHILEQIDKKSFDYKVWWDSELKDRGRGK